MGFRVLAVTAALLAGIGAAADAQTTQTRSQAQIEAEREQARFRAMDVNKDRVITRREWQGYARAFDRFDTNKDGLLSGSEIWIPARRNPAAGERGYSEEDQAREELLATFHRADVNNDGRLGRNEWWSDATTFARVDRNRDGLLTPAEYIGTDESIDLPTGTSGNDAQRQTRAYKAGYERGLTEGRQAGKEDKEGPNRWDLEGQRELEQADSGYNIEFGRRDDYQAGYRSGFRLGYRQGFGQR
jgi:hypothetical protein